jgi:hypothetical protein
MTIIRGQSQYLCNYYLVIFRFVAVCYRCVHAYDVPFRRVYITRHHTERYIIRMDAPTTYSHNPEDDEACTLTSSSCTSTVIKP